MSIRVWQDELRLRTYLLGPEDPNPPWHRSGYARIYPYPMQDDLTDEVAVVSYRALHIENEYLHAIVLPQLGGRLYSLYDKTAGREVFYRNNVVKYGLVARRGAWISGGIEFNFPQGHTCVTVSPVQWARCEDVEGKQATIVVGYIDRVCRMRCSVRLSLAEGEARLRQDVMLHNPRPVRQRHYFWANSAVPARDDLRLVYPCNRARTLGGEWPYPVVNGRDMSLYRNHEMPNDIFALDARDDFFGCYYEDNDVGLVHWSDHRVNIGKKFFTWGTADEGMIWVDLLTDEDGQYVELQSGRFVDQSTFEFLYPYQKVEWTEYWYPVNGTGGFAWATDEAVLNLKVSEGMAQVGAMVNRGHVSGELVLRVEGQEVWRAAVSLRPAGGWKGEARHASIAAEKRMDLALLVGGREIIRYEHPPAYRTRQPLQIRSAPIAAADDPNASATELCAHAVRREKITDFDGARNLYQKALQKDPRCVQARLGLGILDYQTGLYESARTHLEEAVGQDPENDEARYYLALVLICLGEEEHAEGVLWWLMGRQACRVEAAITLAKLYVRRGDGFEALRVLRGVPDTPTARFLRAVAERMVGIRTIGMAPEGLDDPLAVEFQAEMYLREVRLGNDVGAQKAAIGRLLQATAGDPEVWLEAALAYREIGMNQEMGLLLRLAKDSIGRGAQFTMPAYFLAELAASELETKCESEADLAFSECGPSSDYCFPSRLEELEVLQSVAERNPNDWKARLYMGNLLAFLGRREEALAAWLEAAATNDRDAVLCRNIGLAYQLWHEDYCAALQWYAKAIERRPDEYHLYVERDRCLCAAGVGYEERLRALERAPEAVLRRSEVAAIRVECLVGLKRWDEAVDIMRTHKFRPWEGARAMHHWWTEALLGRAQLRREAGDLAGALADYELALTYPRNLGVGRSAHPDEARIHRLLAETAREAGDFGKWEKHMAIAAEEESRRIGGADVGA